jgi:hypothetical protein
MMKRISPTLAAVLLAHAVMAPVEAQQREAASPAQGGPGRFTVRIVQVNFPTQSPRFLGRTYELLRQGHRWVMVGTELTNLDTARAWHVLSRAFTVTDAQGTSYPLRAWGFGSQAEGFMPTADFEDMQFGERSYGLALLFSVPESATGLSLHAEGCTPPGPIRLR